jgi:hypothetical protein
MAISVAVPVSLFPKRDGLIWDNIFNVKIMKQLSKTSLALLLAMAWMTSCKKSSDTPLTPSMKEDDPTLSVAAPAGHLAIGPFNGVGTPYFRYAGGTTYVAVTGSLGNNIIRNAAGGAPLLNVTGLAIIGGTSFCLTRPAVNVNWQIWRFPIGDPNSATFFSSINGTANFVLSDLEKDPTAARWLLLNRTAQRLSQVPVAGGAVNITLSGSYVGVPNVSGLGMVGASPFILGQNGGTGYLMLCNAALTPAWALALATYTPPVVPFAFTESGCFWDATISNSFVVGSQGANWTQTVPAGGPGAPVAPFWQFANVRIIDFSPL